eukprot:803694-Rhodomonas_salina.3
MRVPGRGGGRGGGSEDRGAEVSVPAYADARRCPVLTCRMAAQGIEAQAGSVAPIVLRVRYAMSGTEIALGVARLRWRKS